MNGTLKLEKGGGVFKRRNAFHRFYFLLPASSIKIVLTDSEFGRAICQTR